jgi:hypothetical protein
MVPYDIIGALRTYANTNNWVFLSGPDWMRDYEATKATYQDGQLVLGVDFQEAIPTRRAGTPSDIRYPGILLLGRKFDPDSTPVNLDETFIQKYDARLLDLTTAMSNFIKEFVCSNELEVESENMSLRLNSLDETIDFAVNRITFIGDGV